MKITLPPITPGPWLLQDDSYDGDKTRLTVFSETASRAMQKWHTENPDKPKGGFSNGTDICSAHIKYNGSGKNHGPPMILEADEMITNVTACAAVPDLLETLLLAHQLLPEVQWALRRTGHHNGAQECTTVLEKITAALKKAGCTEAGN